MDTLAGLINGLTSGLHQTLVLVNEKTEDSSSYRIENYTTLDLLEKIAAHQKHGYIALFTDAVSTHQQEVALRRHIECANKRTFKNTSPFHFIG